MIFCVGKSYVNKFYGGNVQGAIDALDGQFFTDEFIIKAFKTRENANRFIEANKSFCHFVEV